MKKVELEGPIKALTSQRNEITWQDVAMKSLDTSDGTAKQFGPILCLFNNEITRINIVRDRADQAQLELSPSGERTSISVQTLGPHVGDEVPHCWIDHAVLGAPEDITFVTKS